jgi:hypothetical protein
LEAVWRHAQPRRLRTAHLDGKLLPATHDGVAAGRRLPAQLLHRARGHAHGQHHGLGIHHAHIGRAGGRARCIQLRQHTFLGHRHAASTQRQHDQNTRQRSRKTGEELEAEHQNWK